jgi:hypothetical protein
MFMLAMKSRHRIALPCLLALLCAGLLSGCGQSSPAKDDLQTAPPFVPAAAAAATPPIAQPDAVSPTPSAADALTVTPQTPELQLLHERDDYTVAPPDILMVDVRLPDRDEEVRLRGVNGEHLVSPDGDIDLGERFGIIPAAGLTPQEIQRQVQQRLAEEAQNYDVTISVVEQNSKFYYIIVQVPGAGDTVMRMPLVTGEEDVANALQHVKDTDLHGKHIWIARPTAGGDDIILPVSSGAEASGWTMHRLEPGDRIFIADTGPKAKAR